MINIITTNLHSPDFLSQYAWIDYLSDWKAIFIVSDSEWQSFAENDAFKATTDYQGDSFAEKKTLYIAYKSFEERRIICGVYCISNTIS